MPTSAQTEFAKRAGLEALDLNQLQKLKDQYAGTQYREIIDQYFERRKEQDAANYQRKLAETPLDLSFRTPEYLAAQDVSTLAPIRREFGTARKQGIDASLRTGGPVGAFITSLQGQEGDVLAEQGGRNFLGDVEFGANLAQRKFGNVMDVSQFEEGRRQFNEQVKAQKEAQKRSFLGQTLGTLGSLAGTAASIAFPPAAPAIAAGNIVSGGFNRAFGGSLRLDDPRRRLGY